MRPDSTVLVIDGKIRQIKIKLDEDLTGFEGLEKVISVNIPEVKAPKIDKEPEMPQAVITMYR